MAWKKEFTPEEKAKWAADKTAKKLEKNLTVISDTAKVILKSFE